MLVETPHVIALDQLSQYENLSYEALGLLLRLLAKNREEVFRDEMLRKDCGETKLKRITDELIQEGHLFFHRAYYRHQWYSLWLVSSIKRTPQEFQNSRTFEFLVNQLILDRKEVSEEDSSMHTVGISPNPGNPDVVLLSSSDIISCGSNNNTNNNMYPGNLDANAPTVTPVQAVNKRVYSHSTDPYILSCHLLHRIETGPLPNIHRRRTDTEQKKEEFLQKQAYHFDLLLRVDNISPEDVVKVLEWTQDHKFWKKNVLSAEKFRREFFRYQDLMNDEQGNAPTVKDDPNPELTKELLSTFRKLINNPSFQPNSDDKNRLIEASIRCERFFKHKEQCERNTWGELLLECLERAYINVGHDVFIGHMWGDFTWDQLMPQYIAQCGLQ